MRYELLECHGFESAIKATMLSFGKTSFDSFEATIDDMKRLSNKLAPMDGGHNKFLEQIQYWILIQAPLFWWKEADTYRHASKSSESTMHKSWKNGLTDENFEGSVFQDTLNNLNNSIREYNSELTTPERKYYLERLIFNNLPDGYLQTRMINLNAKCLRNIYFQRRNHKLQQWRDFCKWIENLPHGDLITAELRSD